MRLDRCCWLVALLLGATDAFIVKSAWRPSLSALQLTTKGDARGAALLVEDASIFRGPTQILNEINWRVEPTSKWGIVGGNGAGKSSLLKALVGEIDVEEGNVIVSNSMEVGYLQQTAVAGSNKTIYEEAASAMKDIQAARDALDQAQSLVEEDASPSNLKRLDAATERFEAVGGYTQEQTVANVLKGLGFEDMNKRCDELSGGWQMRVSLARLLLSSPSLLVLDEPSNHLDVNARKWLANYLANYKAGAMILVTHDVALLQSVSHIAEITSGTLHTYKSCTYNQFLQEKQRRADAAVKEYERNQKKAAQLQGFVDRFGASATKASAAQSRVKQLEKMKKQGLLDAPNMAETRRFRPTLVLPDPPSGLVGERLLSLQDDAQVGWDKSRPLVSNVNLQITKGMKLLLRGPNGAGKSTLMATLRGTLEPIQGTRTASDDLRLGVFTQDLAQELDQTTRAVDLVVAHARSSMVGEQEARNVMGRLGLSGDKALQRVGDLSGGEKARVVLSMFCLKPAHILMLDEPSNHLDVECIQALSQALNEWEQGAIVLVSHDQSFCKDIGFTHIGTVQDDSLVVEQRSLRDSDWNKFTDGEDKNAVESSTKEKPQLDRKLQKQAYNAPKRIAKLETLIEESEQRVAELEDKMMTNGANVDKLMELTAEKDAEEEKIALYMEEWEQLEELLLAVAAQ